MKRELTYLWFHSWSAAQLRLHSNLPAFGPVVFLQHCHSQTPFCQVPKTNQKKPSTLLIGFEVKEGKVRKGLDLEGLHD